LSLTGAMQTTRAVFEENKPKAENLKRQKIHAIFFSY